MKETESKLVNAARAIGLNKLYRGLIRRPTDAVRASLRAGGPIEQRKTEQGREEMILAAGRLPPLSPRLNARPVDVFYMTGSRHWYQTVFCFHSLYAHSDIHFVPHIIDDGTIDQGIKDRLVGAIPWIVIRSQDEIVATLDRVLPEARYPTLRAWRLRQPLTRKIIDLHAGQHGWKMLLDSDMLFFRRPDWLISWCQAPDRPAYMIDCVEAYGYSAVLRAEVCGSDQFPEKANIGIFGWKSEETDFDWLEYAVRTLFEREGPAYNITQGLTSMMFAGRPCAAAPAEDYIVLPTLDEGRAPTAVLHHYVAESKRSYYQHGWRIAAGQIAQARG